MQSLKFRFGLLAACLFAASIMFNFQHATAAAPCAVSGCPAPAPPHQPCTADASVLPCYFDLTCAWTTITARDNCDASGAVPIGSRCSIGGDRGNDLGDRDLRLTCG